MMRSSVPTKRISRIFLYRLPQVRSFLRPHHYTCMQLMLNGWELGVCMNCMKRHHKVALLHVRTSALPFCISWTAEPTHRMSYNLSVDHSLQTALYSCIQVTKHSCIHTDDENLENIGIVTASPLTNTTVNQHRTLRNPPSWRWPMSSFAGVSGGVIRHKQTKSPHTFQRLLSLTRALPEQARAFTGEWLTCLSPRKLREPAKTDSDADWWSA